jgi:hypothetical protein
LHWPLVFPEVFERGGFDAIIGNPPFLGGSKLTGSLGTAYREHLVGAIGRGARGSADLVAYFVLRAHDLLNGGGQTGLIATNTLAQGDTREVGLTDWWPAASPFGSRSKAVPGRLVRRHSSSAQSGPAEPRPVSRLSTSRTDLAFGG